jgi:hypothetical protein
VQGYANLASTSARALSQLAAADNLVEALVEVSTYTGVSCKVKAAALLLLAYVALQGPLTAARIAMNPCLEQVGLGILSCTSRAMCGKGEEGGEGEDEEGKVALHMLLLLNNLAAVGGEETAEALAGSKGLMRLVAACLISATERVRLEQLVGIINRLSQSQAGAQQLVGNGMAEVVAGVMERVAAAQGDDDHDPCPRPTHPTSLTTLPPQAPAARAGVPPPALDAPVLRTLAHMAMANMAAHTQGSVSQGVCVRSTVQG